MSVWLTSDTHFGHKLVSGLRGFEDPDHHDAALMENWRKVVKKEDTVWVLGDLCMASPTEALGIISSLPGTKHLISGNHDACHPMHRDAYKHIPRYLEAFASVQPFARQKWAGINFLLSHFPYERDRGEARYMQYRLPDHGEWLLHGHVHTDERVIGHEIHVGLDAWDLTPVSLTTILKVMV